MSLNSMNGHIQNMIKENPFSIIVIMKNGHIYCTPDSILTIDKNEIKEIIKRNNLAKEDVVKILEDLLKPFKKFIKAECITLEIVGNTVSINPKEVEAIIIPNIENLIENLDINW